MYDEALAMYEAVLAVMEQEDVWDQSIRSH